MSQETHLILMNQETYLLLRDLFEALDEEGLARIQRRDSLAYWTPDSGGGMALLKKTLSVLKSYEKDNPDERKSVSICAKVFEERRFMSPAEAMEDAARLHDAAAHTRAQIDRRTHEQEAV